MAYPVRTMINMDVAQVNGIDREAFPTQWPPPNYQRELQNHLAHYIVAYDDTRTLEETASRPDSLHSSLVSRIRHWLKIKPYPSKVSPSLPRQYIVGFAGIWIMADDAHITNLAVRKEYQRRSIGELLLLSIINLAGECKARIITLEVRASNVPAQNLYRKFGFVQVGVRHGYYLDNKEDAIIMSTDNIMSYSFQEHLQRLREALYVKGVAG